MFFGTYSHNVITMAAISVVPVSFVKDSNTAGGDVVDCWKVVGEVRLSALGVVPSTSTAYSVVPRVASRGWGS